MTEIYNGYIAERSRGADGQADLLLNILRKIAEITEGRNTVNRDAPPPSLDNMSIEYDVDDCLRIRVFDDPDNLCWHTSLEWREGVKHTAFAERVCDELAAALGAVKVH